MPGLKLDNLQILITAGPTQEPIDPVRFISNRSSGKMGYAVAEAASQAGAKVILISGPVALRAPDNVKTILVETALEMERTVMEHASSSDIFISAAAVADYRVEHISPRKCKKSAQAFNLNLVPNPDILSGVAKLKKRPFIVGFAAETEYLSQNAYFKLLRKNLDLIAANDVSRKDIGFDSVDNALTVLWRGGRLNLRKANKNEIAQQLLTIVQERYEAQYSSQNSQS